MKFTVQLDIVGMRKHCVRKHKNTSYNPVVTKDPEREAEVEDLLLRSTVQQPQVKPPNKPQAPARPLMEEVDDSK